MKAQKINNLFIDDGGSGEQTILFLHSLAGNTQQWTHQLDHFRKTHRAIGIDLRGHGQSPNTAIESYTIEGLVEDVHVVISKLGIKQFVLVGHSMGGAIAGAYAGTYPQHIAGLLLVDPSGDATQMPAEDKQGYLGALASDAYVQVIEGYWNQLLTGAKPDVAAQVMQDLRDTSKETVVGCFNALFAYHPIQTLRQYDGPKLSLITPANDVPIGLHNLIADLPHKLIEGTGHWLHMDKPDEFNQLLTQFMTNLKQMAHKTLN
ncbi:MAG: alpha/beta hydrolase [Chloroflexi bacterium]|nr:alpha/beta hydrolase [Chloroflexota bacterium]